MDLRILILAAFTLMVSTGHSQLLELDFGVDLNTPLVGPSPISVSSSAAIIGGKLSAKGSASDPKRDIDLDFDGSTGYWDVAGIDLSISYQREESTAWWFSRLNNNFRFGISGGKVQVKYEIDNGSGSTTITGSNLYSVPNDDVFRTYRFAYEPVFGIAEIFVDGVVVWTNDGPDNSPLHWNGAGNFRIGDGMDGTGAVEGMADNISITSSTLALPIKLTSFKANLNATQVDLAWVTSSELNNDYFSIERSKDGFEFNEIKRVSGAGTSTSDIAYFEIDNEPPLGVSYYRLKQVDFNGDYTYSSIIPVERTNQNEPGLSIFPNPIRIDHPLNIRLENMRGQEVLVMLRDMNGSEFYGKVKVIESNSEIIVSDLSNEIKPGIYLVIASSKNELYSQKLIVK